MSYKKLINCIIEIDRDTIISPAGQHETGGVFLWQHWREGTDMLQSCAYCGRIHDHRYDCGKRPRKRYIRTEAERGRYTEAWHKKAEEIKSRSYFLCSYCLENGALTYEGLETHHIVSLRERPDLLLEDTNLICLCRHHHEMAERGAIPAETLRTLVMKRDSPPPNRFSMRK